MAIVGLPSGKGVLIGNWLKTAAFPGAICQCLLTAWAWGPRHARAMPESWLRWVAWGEWKTLCPCQLTETMKLPWCLLWPPYSARPPTGCGAGPFLSHWCTKPHISWGHQQKAKVPLLSLYSSLSIKTSRCTGLGSQTPFCNWFRQLIVTLLTMTLGKQLHFGES